MGSTAGRKGRGSEPPLSERGGCNSFYFFKKGEKVQALTSELEDLRGCRNPAGLRTNHNRVAAASPTATLHVSDVSPFDSVMKLLIRAASLSTTGLGSTLSGVSQGAQIESCFFSKSRVKPGDFSFRFFFSSCALSLTRFP